MVKFSESKGCILHSPNLQTGQRLPKIHFQRQRIQVQMSTFWPNMCSLGLHQDTEVCIHSAETIRSEGNYVYRQRYQNW